MKIVNGWHLLDDEHDITEWLENKPKDEVFWQGQEWIDAVLNLTEKRGVFLDIGANYGFVSAIMSDYFKEVLSFELIPSTYDCLEQNVKKYNNVHPYNFGLGHQEDIVLTMRRKKTAGHSQVINDEKIIKQYKNNTIPKKKRIEVREAKIKTLDSLNLDSIDLIKIDVEGFEEYVLQGAENTIKKLKPAICLEVSNPKKVSVVRNVDCVKLLESWGYNVVGQIREDFFFTTNKDTL